MQYVYLDTEFMPNDLTSKGLISVGIVAQHASYYAVNAAMDVPQVCRSQWMVDNVWKHLPNRGVGVLDYSHRDVKDYHVIREEVGAFFHGLAVEPDRKITDYTTVIVNHGAQDVVRLHTLWYNDWSEMPDHIPTFADDMGRIERDAGVKDGFDSDGVMLPVQLVDTMHHALMDARHDREVHQHILKHQVAP